ncbi:hypothetical protein SEMRO_1347_G264900.1 [Seminavis robusta]|uniref:Uncharacterized protein n=1 Tax=Seminavis robusta TaxID=568900 RepID=A0A9N8EMP3_9STRA|nr:hypothetical protein SEMRO_1347_G264900.1 [Seminavis robusta]|eukprot:Sro1347_g264900.1 n/a (260) ;mRNA; f:8093-8937
MTDFIYPPVRVDVKVTGIGGAGSATYKGTVKWEIQDDTRVSHSWIIPDTYYHEHSPYRLLSPQHWAQARQEGNGTVCITYHDAVKRFWQDCRYVKTVILDGATNIALIRSKPSYDRFNAFCTAISDTDECRILDETELMSMPAAQLVSDDEELADDDISEASESIRERRPPDLPDVLFDELEHDDEFRNNANTNPARPIYSVVPEDEEVQQQTPQAQFLALHYKHAHLLPEKMQALARRGNQEGMENEGTNQLILHTYP